MNTEKLNRTEESIKGEDEHLESGDNPEERERRDENAPEEGNPEDNDFESGDNPDERRKGL